MKKQENITRKGEKTNQSIETDPGRQMMMKLRETDFDTGYIHKLKDLKENMNMREMED